MLHRGMKPPASRGERHHPPTILERYRMRTAMRAAIGFGGALAAALAVAAPPLRPCVGLVLGGVFVGTSSPFGPILFGCGRTNRSDDTWTLSFGNLIRNED
jgi:hypothetical protein